MADTKKDIAALQKAIREPLKKSKKFDKDSKDLDKVVNEISRGVMAVLVGMKLGDETEKRLRPIEAALKPKPKKERCKWCWVLAIIALLLLFVGIVYLFLWLDPICFEDWSIAIGCPEPTSASPPGL